MTLLWLLPTWPVLCLSAFVTDESGNRLMDEQKEKCSKIKFCVGEGQK